MKVIKYTMISLGVILVISGIYLWSQDSSLELVDVTPPNVLYMYPQNNMMYKLNEVNEIVVYVQDTSGADITYLLDGNTIDLKVTPYTEIEHPMIIEDRKYPDITKDGYVNEDDRDLLANYFGADAQEYPQYDLNNDGEINTNDMLVISYYWRTVSYSTKISYLDLGIHEFEIVAVDEYGNTQTYEGMFDINDYNTLIGYWLINNDIVDTSIIEVSEPEITVSFIKESETIPDEAVNVTVIIDNETFNLQHVSSGTWSGTVKVTDKYTQLTLKAISSVGEANIESVTIYYVEQKGVPTITILLIVIGILLIIGGLLK